MIGVPTLRFEVRKPLIIIVESGVPYVSRDNNCSMVVHYLAGRLSRVVASSKI